MGPVIAVTVLGLAIITMVGLAGWVHNTRKTARQEAAAKLRWEQHQQYLDWHLRTYGFLPQPLPPGQTPGQRLWNAPATFLDVVVGTML